MLDIASIKSLVELFKDLLTIIDRHSRNKAEAFEKICKPLYERLEIIATAYHGIAHNASRALNRPDPKLREILSSIQRERGNLILLRNGILGEAQAFLAQIHSKRTNEFEILACNFVQRITSFFHTDLVMLGYNPGEPGYSKLTGLMGEIRQVIADNLDDNRKDEVLMHMTLRLAGVLPPPKNRTESGISFRDLDKLRGRAAFILRDLEEDWKSVAQYYGKLKVYCLM